MDGYRFTTRFTVRVGDINYGGHMGNDKYLLLFHDARMRYLASLGFSEANISDGVGLIMNVAHVEYKGEVFLNDELSVGVRVTDLEGLRFRMEFRVEKAEDTLVATGYTGMVGFDYAARRPARLPDDFVKRVCEE